MKRTTGLTLIVLTLVLLTAISLFKRPVQKSTTAKEPINNPAIRNTSYRQATLAIEGMWCTSCAVGAEYALKEKNGVVAASIQYREGETATGSVLYNPQLISPEEIITSLSPYRATITQDTSAK